MLGRNAGRRRSVLASTAVIAGLTCLAGAALGAESLAGAEGVLRFQPPALEVAQRPAFGAQAGTPASFEVPPTIQPIGAGMVLAAYGAAALAAGGTLLAAWLLSRTRDAQGRSTRAFTLGTKLSLGLGGLATLLAFAGSTSISIQRSVANDSIKVRGFATDADVCSALDDQITATRLATRAFLLSNAQPDLDTYSDAAASLQARLKDLDSAIQDPQRRAMAKEVADAYDQYTKAFEGVVPVIDRRNAVVASQKGPAAEQAEAMLSKVIQQAGRGQDAETLRLSTEVFEAMAHARVTFLAFLRQNNDQAQAQAKAARERLVDAYDALAARPHKGETLEQIDALGDAIEFYAQKLDECFALQAQRNELVFKGLNTVGPVLMAKTNDLVESIAQAEATGAEQALATIEQAKWMLSAIVAASLLVAMVTATLIVRSINRSSRVVVSTLARVAERDLTVPPINSAAGDEFGQLARATDSMLTSLRDVLNEVKGTSNQVAAAATQIAASAEEMARGMEQQSGQVSQIGAAVQEMSSSVVEVAKKSGEASDQATRAGQQAGEGGQVVQETIAGMQAINEAVSSGAQSVSELGKRGEQIGEIIKVINDIADQTNLLALNAAIEAARAGEHGRGFAVVADEVRKLAERTQKATEEVASSIRAIQDETRVAVERMNTGTRQVEVGVEKANAAGATLRGIVDSSKDVATMIQSIAAAAEQQSSASEQISRSLESITNVTRESTAGASQAAQAATELSGKAEQLRELVAKFRLAESTGGGTGGASGAPMVASKRKSRAMGTSSAV